MIKRAIIHDIDVHKWHVTAIHSGVDFRIMCEEEALLCLLNHLDYYEISIIIFHFLLIEIDFIKLNVNVLFYLWLTVSQIW